MADYLNADQFRVFIAKLIDLTTEGRLNWIQDNDSEFKFNTLAADFLYQVRSVDEDDVHPYEMTIWRFLSETGDTPWGLLQKLDSDTPDYEDSYAQLSELYVTVKRQTMGIEQTAMEIMKSLDNL